MLFLQNIYIVHQSEVSDKLNIGYIVTEIKNKLTSVWKKLQDQTIFFHCFVVKYDIPTARLLAFFKFPATVSWLNFKICKN